MTMIERGSNAMGDLRAEVKIEMHLYGKDYKAHWGWINWSDNGDGIDRRVLDWFRECTDDARSRLAEHIYEGEREQRELAQEKRDRAEYERLKQKYGGSEDVQS